MAALFFANAGQAESLDFTAEHILEVPMDFRYLSLPDADIDDERPYHIQVGAGRVTGNVLETNVGLFSLNWQYRLSPEYALTIASFYDYYSFGGSDGNSIAEVSFASTPSLPSNTPVFASDVSGSAQHVGIGFSIVRQYDSGYAWQAGVIAERLDVKAFRVNISSLALPTPFTGTIDYAATYNAVTPFASLGLPKNIFGKHWSGHLEIVAAWPLPRVGFEGRIVGSGVDVSGSTDDVGNGKHIPDPFLGVKYRLTHNDSGLGIDIGATLYSYLAETKIHEGTDPPLFISVSWGF